jgi:YggT family protein
MNLNPFINLINSIISIYSFMLIATILIRLLTQFNILNPYQPIVKRLNSFGYELFEPIFYYIRKIIPPVGNIDFSPLILLLLLNFLKEFLITYLYKF